MRRWLVLVCVAAACGQRSKPEAPTQQLSGPCAEAARASPHAAAERLCPAGTRADHTEAGDRTGSACAQSDDRPHADMERAVLHACGYRPALVASFYTEDGAEVAPPGNGELHWCTGDDGRDHGPYAETFADGATKVAGQFRDGEFDGTWTFWTPGGWLRAYQVYRRGELIAEGECMALPSEP